MSGNSGPLASTKGDPSSAISKSTTKSGYDHLDVNRLFKGKTTEPVAKSVTQKHGMQTLGKALPARRAGNTVSLKSEEIPTENSVSPTPGQGHPNLPNNSQGPPQGYGLSEDQRRHQELQHQHQQGWTNSHQQPPAGPHRLQNMQGNGPMHDKKWTGQERANGSYASQRFAQEFPSLDAAGEPHKAPPPNFAATGGPGSRQANSKSQDNQYGPGPILRPQTEGSWTQGGGRRPSGPPPLNAPSNYPPDRVNLGGPTPPPMSLVQGGHMPPPPLGAFQMQFRGQMQNSSYMYPLSGAGGFYPGGPGSAVRYGMPIPQGAPPPPGGLPVDGPPRAGRQAPPSRPGSHFLTKPIIRAEEMERMDEIGTQEGGWAFTNDDIDYNKKICFDDDEDGGSDQRKQGKVNNVGPKQETERKEEERPVKILERERSVPETAATSRPKDPPQPYEYENGEDWNIRRGYENKERDRGGRRLRDDDWRSGSNRYEEDNRGKKGPPGGGRQDSRALDFQSQSSKYGNTNLPPRFLKNQGQVQGQGHGPIPSSFKQQPTNQRQTPSPISISTAAGKDRDGRDIGPPREGPYKILERSRGDSESSRESGGTGRYPRDKRNFNTYPDPESRNDRYSEQDYGKNSRYGSSDFGRDRQQQHGHDEPRKPNNQEHRNSVSSQPETKDSETRVNNEAEEKRDESKQAFRKKPELSTTSWAEEMDEDEALSESTSDSRKKEPTIPPPKKEEPKSREAKRVIIHQTKVADMRTHVKEASPPKKDEHKHDERDRRGPRRDQKHHQNNPPEPRQHPKDEHKAEHAKHHGPIQLKTETVAEISVESRKPLKEPSPPVQSKKEEPKPRENKRVIIHQTKVGDLRPPVKEPSPPTAATPAKKEEPKHEEKEKRDERPEHHDRRNERHDNRQDDHRSERRDDNRRVDTRPERRDDIRRDDHRPDRRDGNRRDENRPERRDDIRKDDNRPERREDNRRDDRHDNRHDNRYDNRRDNRRDDRRDDRRDNRRGPPHLEQNKPAEPLQQQPPKTEAAPPEPKLKVQPPPAQPKEEVPAPIEKPKPTPEDVSETKEIGDVDDKSNNSRKNGSERSSDYIYKRGAKTPAGPRRNQNQRGASRLQGYGPPSDRKPFSSNVNKKDEEAPSKEKAPEGQVNTPKPTPPVTAAPIPLMALGEISPPDMPPRNRHHGGGYRDRDRERDRDRDRDSHGNIRAVPPRLQRGGGSERGARGEHHQSNRGKKKPDKVVLGTPATPAEKEAAQDDRDVEKEAEVPKKATVVEPAPAPSGNAWTKPINQTLRSDLIQTGHQQSSTPPPEAKETQPTPSAPPASLLLPTHPPALQQSHGFQPLDNTCPKTTMIFENTKLKSGGKFSEPFNKGPKGPEEQQQQQPSSLPNSIEKTLNLPLSYGKASGVGSGNVGVSLDFGASFETDSVPVVPKSGAVPRPFAQMSHQPSPISPQAVELTENLQAVRSLWDSPVANEQPNSLPSEDSSLSFGGDTFKRPEVSREVGPSLQTSIGYTSGNPPTSVSVIAKPTSSSSPNSANNIRMKTVQPPPVVDPQPHVPLSYSPFGYGIQQHQGANAFGGIPSAVSAPTQQMYGKPHTAPGPNPVYPGFQHPESSHVMGGNTRSQFSGYPSVQPGGGPGPYGSLYLTAFDNHYSVPSYGHGHQGQSGGGPPGQVPQGSSRMSPSSAMPLPLTSSSGLVVGGVGMNSSGSNSFKSGRNGTGSHQALPHPGHHGPQQGYSQMTHHLNHPSHHMPGPQKGNYSQSGIPPQTQPPLYIQYDPSQAPPLNMGQNYMSSGGMRSGGGPPPAATPPMQGLPSSGSYYGSSSNQGGVYPGGNSQGGNMQQMHMAVAPGPQSLPGPNLYGLQFTQPPPMNMQGYSSQGPPGSVGGNPMIRPGHTNRK